MVASCAWSACSRVLTCSCDAVTEKIRISSEAPRFSPSNSCWPSAIRLSSDWFRSFSSIRAWASDAVRSSINWLWGCRFRSPGLAGDGLGVGERGGPCLATSATGEVVGLGLGEGDAPGEAARTPVGTTSTPSSPTRLSSRTATLRPRFGPATTVRREFTVLPKSLQLLRRGLVLPALSNPKRCLRGPLPAHFVFDPGRCASSASSVTLTHFHIFVTPCLLSPFLEAHPNTCAGLSSATILKNQLELSRGK